MRTDLRLFAIVVWVGVLANWAFGIWAVFLDTDGLPYLLWAALPTGFRTRWGGSDGYAGFGFLWNAGKPTPIGLPM